MHRASVLAVTYTSRETVLDIGPIHATADREKTVYFPPVLGGLALAGGIVLLVADTIARTAFEPRELPVGIVTALVGAPAFAAILLRRRVET